MPFPHEYKPNRSIQPISTGVRQQKLSDIKTNASMAVVSHTQNILRILLSCY
jgi:hypothetical protein